MHSPPGLAVFSGVVERSLRAKIAVQREWRSAFFGHFLRFCFAVCTLFSAGFAGRELGVYLLNQWVALARGLAPCY